MEVRRITKQSFHKELTTADGNIALLFSSTIDRWSRLAEYAFDDIAANYTGRMPFFKAGVISSLSNMFGVQCTPTIVIIKDWKVVGLKSPISAMRKENVLREIEELLEE